MSVSNDPSRSFITTPEDHGGIALTVCTLLLAWTVLCLGARAYVRLEFSGPFGIDDTLCSVATALAVLQVVICCAAISAGFGKATKLLSTSQILRIEQLMYTAQLIYILVNATTKCCVAMMYTRLTPARQQRRVGIVLVMVSVAWGVASFLAETVGCAKHAPWGLVGGKYNDILLRWEVITIFGVILELAIWSMPAWIIWSLQTTRRRKSTAVFMFSLRLLIIAPAIVRLPYLSKAINSPNPFLVGVIEFVCLQVEMHYSLMSSTIPCLKPFVNSFDTGWGTADTQNIAEYSLRSHDKLTKDRSRAVSNKQHSNLQQEEDEIELRPVNEGVNTTLVRSATPQRSDIRPSSGRNPYPGSIWQTQAVDVQYDDSPPTSQSIG